MFRKLNPKLVFYILGGTGSLAGGMLVVLTVYYVTSAHLDPLQLVLVGTVLEAVYLLCEVPTGVVADSYSRRLSVIIGIFIVGAAWILEGSLPFFAAILLAEAVRAVGEAFLSGATQAWLADEVGEEQVGPILVRSGQVNRLLGILGTVLGVGLGIWRISLPILLAGGMGLLLGLFLVLFMSENGFKPAPVDGKNAWQNLAATFRQGAGLVRRSQVLIAILLISATLGLSSEGFDRLSEAHFLIDLGFPELGNLQPVAWFGIISIAADLIGVMIVQVSRRRLERLSLDVRRMTGWLMALSLCLLAAGIAFALAGSFTLALLAIFARSALAALYFPLYDAWQIRHIRPEVRATVLSLTGQMNAIGQVAGGPLVGVVGKLASIPAALVFSGLLYAPTPLLYRWIRRREESGSEEVEILQPAVEVAAD